MNRIVYEILAERDSYLTPTARRRVMDQRLLSVQALFVKRLLGIVFRAGRKAKRGRYDDRDWVLSSLETLRSVEDCGCTVEVDGMNTIRTLDGPAVFISNHMSLAETFMLPCLVQPLRPVTFVIKPSLMTYPVFGHVMRSRKPIVVTRDNPRQDLQIVLEEGRKRLESGISVILFPQTTRTTEFLPEKFNSLGIKLAKNNGVPVVPVALKTDGWANGKRFKDAGRLDPSKRFHFSFGEPFLVSGPGKAEHEAVVRFISDRLRMWSEADR